MDDVTGTWGSFLFSVYLLFQKPMESKDYSKISRQLAFFKELTKHLATKEDVALLRVGTKEELALLRVDLAKIQTRLIPWIVGTSITVGALPSPS